MTEEEKQDQQEKRPDPQQTPADQADEEQDKQLGDGTENVS